ncbi:MAG: HNH endonuclease [Armatimonadetes bacterium CG_4_10_14_3_um_filter_66_18]|nr:HNH endonuclease [Armatimonadota bacterium]OIP05091.1 MAG: HNH endonuclease [Armatimonadetes bacterium CG2_30_66_41]PIU95318.1 MAG: HNH endonuclease [Armatimonadetes bacterium CG06_land_8_20_14_3_00_66_21]PIX43705.1 MAG: HNH endonuclease [Armatimonadetes bacterium CG_4_8_14_3_um_filter_66_20]PIY37441.1 MAG: HNH endonuclease [Armatimonadetes bacterium CG_4_10_14_3_um_filter_66_18]PIZ30458.1 MAG: HNH endonuclease [Armatimonadetes bacterium CG_4_10_14_0_8_um_filter_66_14]PJB68370.1 MAG: HNH e
MSGSRAPREARARVRAAAAGRCGYCLARQEHLPWPLELEHLVPRAKGGTDREENLWLACHSCNLHKSDQTHGMDPLTGRRVRLFNPRRQRWPRHFRWSAEGAHIVGRTACGRATVVALSLNNLTALTVRRNWIRAGWHPPSP